MAVHFDLFGELVRQEGLATAEDVANATNARIQARSSEEPLICTLAQATVYHSCC